MKPSAVRDLIDRIIAIDAGTADSDTLTAGLDDVRRVTAWCESRRLAFAAGLAKQTWFPEKAVGDATCTDTRAGEKTLERAGTVESMPALGDALGNGDVSGEHVDIVSRAIRDLKPALQPQLTGRAAALALAGRGTTPGEFRRIVNRAVREIQSDDGMSRLARQRRATSLRAWIDADGMWHINGVFDPVTGARLAQRLAAALAQRHAQAVPDDCPTDPIAKNDWLRAHALADLIDGAGPDAGRSSVTVVVDATGAHPDSTGGEPVVDWGIPVEIPLRVLADLLDEPNTTVDAVVIRNGVILYAPGNVDLGRATRLANRAQRRALRALYPTCAVPGCARDFNQCVIHHIRWWRHGGRTDLVNLLPLCIRHHHDVHDSGWHLHLASDRTLTITLPDGTTMTTGPPRTRAA